MAIPTDATDWRAEFFPASVYRQFASSDLDTPIEQALLAARVHVEALEPPFPDATSQTNHGARDAAIANLAAHFLTRPSERPAQSTAGASVSEDPQGAGGVFFNTPFGRTYELLIAGRKVDPNETSALAMRAL